MIYYGCTHQQVEFYRTDKLGLKRGGYGKFGIIVRLTFYGDGFKSGGERKDFMTVNIALASRFFYDSFLVG